jgi:hypothetical protein
VSESCNKFEDLIQMAKNSAELAAAQPGAAPLGWKASKLVAHAGVMPSPRGA